MHDLLHECLEHALASYPSRTAIDVPPGRGRIVRQTMTYEALSRAANAIAEGLVARVTGECVVAIFLPRATTGLFAAQLGTLRAGAAFACIDEAFPDAHVAAILDDARPVAVITDARGRARLARLRPLVAVILDVDEFAPQSDPVPDVPRPHWLRASSLAYVIYTSGTTGRPKGVMIEHGAITNLIASDVELFALQPGDRVAQGSSAAYDSSVEETWLAWAHGAALVVLDDDQARSGPDLVGWLRTERITVLCPTPTLLRASGCVHPHAELPHLKLVYAGGEALPQDIAARWSDGIRFENGYGPTECTVTVMRAPIRVGEPITIGQPVRGNRAFVLDAELREVANGTPGELCIAGVGLARGYLGRPELTSERFVEHSTLGRIYRTGDLVRCDANGDHHYLGRIDAQVKLRGYRVELGAIEAVLAAQPGVRAAACRVQSEGSAQILAAHIVPSDAIHAPDLEALRRATRSELPEYMVPSRIALAPSLPVLQSGKLAREALPDIARSTSEADFVPARNEVEARIVAAFQEVLRATVPPSTESDFFLDLGGDSLRAAEVISVLRAEASTARLTVRDLYEARSAAALAVRARVVADVPAPAQPTPPVARPSTVLASIVHVVWLAVALIAAAIVFQALGFEVLGEALRRFELPVLALLAPPFVIGAMAVYVLCAVLMTLTAKRVLIGRYVVMRTTLWSGLHIRAWLVQQVASLVPWTLLQDTIFLGAVLRLLGARVGRRVHIHRGVDLRQGGWDLLEIEDDATVAQDAALRLVQIEGNEVVFGAVTLGARSLLDIRASVGPGGAIGADAVLGPLSWLPPGERIPSGESWNGVPAQSTGRAPPVPASVPVGELSPAVHGALTISARTLRVSASLWIPLVMLALCSLFVAGFDQERVWAFLFESQAVVGGWVVAVLLTVAAAPLSALLGAFVCRWLGRVQTGVISRWSLAYLRVLTKTDAVQAAGELLSGTLFWPWWLRLAGMRVGTRSEISTIIDVVPELIEIGDECFFADGIYLGGPRVRAGTVCLEETRFRRNTFLGNHCVVPAGSNLPEDVLVGVSTVADSARIRPGTSWFGAPPIELPRSPPANLDRRLTHDPGFVRYANRLLWESARLLLPIGPLLAALWWLRSVAAAESVYSSAYFHFVVLPLVTLSAALALMLAVLALKWSLLGRVRPGEHGLWSCWCCRWDFVYMAWGQWARPALARFEGTQLLAWYLRAMGARIGRRVLLDGGFAHVVDPDMLHFEDDATVGCLFQAHSFEDRVLKIDRVTIRRGAWVGPGTVLFYGTDIGAHARVLPHGVVMKHERLPGQGEYVGSPIQRVDQSPLENHSAAQASF